MFSSEVPVGISAALAGPDLFLSLENAGYRTYCISEITAGKLREGKLNRNGEQFLELITNLPAAPAKKHF